MSSTPQHLPKQTFANWGRILSFAFVLVGLCWVFAQSGQINSQHIRQPLPDAHRAQIELETGVAHLNLSATSTGNLIEGRVETFADHRLERSYQQVGEQAYFQLAVKDSWTNILWYFGNKTPNWDLRLSPKLPLDLRIATGVGESVINLKDLNITNLGLSTGVGKTILTLPATGNFRGEVSAGVGETIVRVPARLAVRFWVSAGLGGVRVLGNFHQRGEEYVSRNYQNARHRVDLKISGGVGPIRIEVTP